MLRFRHRFNQHFSTDPSFYEFIAINRYGTEVVFSEKRRYDVTSFGIVGKHPSCSSKYKMAALCAWAESSHFQQLSS